MAGVFARGFAHLGHRSTSRAVQSSAAHGQQALGSPLYRCRHQAQGAQFPRRGLAEGGRMSFDPSDTPGAASTATAGATPAGAGAQAAAGDAAAGGAGGAPRLVVFGGNGFVGSRITEEAVRTGLPVVSISRRGTPPPGVNASWTSQVEWAKGDVFDPASWRSQLQGAVGVISTLGGFGSNDAMFKICGESNISVMEAAAEEGVPRFVFVSVHDFGFPDFVLKGYFNGKRAAEARMAQLFPSGGVALRPGFISGTRQVAGVGVPLQVVGTPLDKLLGVLPAQRLSSLPLVGAAAVPPTAVEGLARAAVAAATDPAVPPGVMDIWKIKADYSA